jgi:hypothetical protein
LLCAVPAPRPGKAEEIKEKVHASGPLYEGADEAARIRRISYIRRPKPPLQSVFDLRDDIAIPPMSLHLTDHRRSIQQSK